MPTLRFALLLLAATVSCSPRGEWDPWSLSAARSHCLTQDHAGFRSRCLSAVWDIRDEARRIAVARQEFAEALETSPSHKRAHLLSFERPVPVLDLFEVLETQSGIEVLELHTWMAAPRRLSAGVGVDSDDAGGFRTATPEEISLQVRRESLSFLRQSIRSMEKTFDPEQNAFIRHQIEDAEAAEEVILAQGPPAYGIRCACSAAQIVMLDERLPALEVRAAEWATWYQQQQPIWPEVIDRILYIRSRGRYGMVAGHESAKIYGEYLASLRE